MAVFIGYKASGKDEVSKSLEARNINYLRASPNQVQHLATVEEYQCGYRNYTNYLPAYMHANLVSTKVDLKVPFHPIRQPLNESVPFRYPGLTVSPTVATAEIVEKMNMLGGREDKIKGERVWVFDSPTSEVLASVAKMPINRGCVTTDNTVNFACIDSIKTTVKILSSFYRTHTYPAFKDDDHFGRIPPTAYEVDTKKRKATKQIHPADAEDMEEEVDPKAESEMDVDDDDLREPDTDELRHDLTISALPNPKVEGRVCWGTDAEAPPGSGLFFPFVLDLAERDGFTVPRVFSRYFSGCFGVNSQGVHKNIKVFRADWGNIGTTVTGKELTHQAFVIDLALPAQAMVFPIYKNDQYEGCLMLGNRFRITVGKEEFVPVPHSELRRAVSDFGGHTTILQAISKEAKWTIPLTETYDIFTDKELSMRKLSTLLIQTGLVEEQRQKIIALARLLSFPNATVAVNPQTLVTALEYLALPDKPVPMSWPLHYSLLFSVDKVASVWSAFGFNAPNFQLPGNPLVPVTATTVDVYDQASKSSKTVPWQKITIRTSPLEAAISSVKTLQETGKIRNISSNRRSTEFSDRTYRGDDFSRIKAALVMFAGTSASGTVAREVESTVAEVVGNVLNNDDEF